MLLYDKYKLIKDIGLSGLKIGDICTVIIKDDKFVMFSFDNNINTPVFMCLEANKFNNYFEKYEEPKEESKEELKIKPKSKANTVTEEYIDRLLDEAQVAVVDRVFDKCIIVSAQLKNGFVITESSACVSPENYDKEIGFDICMNRIKNKLWELEGYRLQCELYNESTNNDSDKPNKTKNEDEKYCNMIGEVANCKLRDESFHCNCPYDCESDCESEFEEKCEGCCKDCPHKETCANYND